MMDRSDLMTKLPTETEEISEFESDLNEFLNEIEGRVQDAYDKLGSIDSIQDLGNVEDAYDILGSLATDLY